MLKNRTLYFGDNLRVLREKFPQNEDGYFDLIYLDPPFNSNRSYNVLFKEGLEDSPAQLHAFEDSWHWTKEAQEQFDDLVQNTNYPQKVSDLMQGLEKLVGHNDMMAYLTMMTIRLIELHRVLKTTGSIFLHCDPTASHYLKVVMDAIYGANNFRNEIVWCYTGNQQPKDSFPKKHDTLLFYSKSSKAKFIPLYEPYSETTIRRYNHVDEDGRKYKMNNYGGKMNKAYIKEEGKRTPDHWNIPWVIPTSKESLGYPTQKPLLLLERVIACCTSEGDWILDPFGGCGTTVIAAEKMKRNWCIIDVTSLAINLVKRRVEDLYPEIKNQMLVDGYPADAAGAKALFDHDPFEFEYWCCDLINARPAGDKAQGKMKGADRGIDGIISFPDKNEKDGRTMDYRKLLVQVKGGHVGASQVRDLVGTVQREKAAGGIFISLERSTKPMQKDAVEAGSYTYNMTGQKYPVIQLLTVEELIEGKKPDHPSAVGYARKAEKVSEDATESMF